MRGGDQLGLHECLRRLEPRSWGRHVDRSRAARLPLPATDAPRMLTVGAADDSYRTGTTSCQGTTCSRFLGIDSTLLVGFKIIDD